MKLFTCPACQQTLHFENFQCTGCGHALAYLPDRQILTALEPVADAAGIFTALGAAGGGARYRLCGNQIDHAACNWAVPDDDDQRFCCACRLNEVIPNLSEPAAKQAWLALEDEQAPPDLHAASSYACRSRRAREAMRGLAFAFKQDLPGQSKVFIGHDARRHHHQRRRGRRPERESARSRWASPTAPCSATFATRSATTTGIG